MFKKEGTGIITFIKNKYKEYIENKKCYQIIESVFMLVDEYKFLKEVENGKWIQRFLGWELNKNYMGTTVIEMEKLVEYIYNNTVGISKEKITLILLETGEEYLQTLGIIQD